MNVFINYNCNNNHLRNVRNIRHEKTAKRKRDSINYRNNISNMKIILPGS